MTIERIDLKQELEDAAVFFQQYADHSEMTYDHIRADSMRKLCAAVVALIERDKAANKVFDSILRAVNDTSGDLGYRSLQYVPAWFKSWAKTMLAAGFTPSTPEAGDIKRAVSIIEPK